MARNGAEHELGEDDEPGEAEEREEPEAEKEDTEGGEEGNEGRTSEKIFMDASYMMFLSMPPWTVSGAFALPLRLESPCSHLKGNSRRSS